MILADSSVWIDFFRNKNTFHVDRLESAVRANRVVLGDLIIAEVLQGVETDRAEREIRNGFASFGCISICDEHIAVQAARNYRTLRDLGITIRKTIDTLIATRCIVDGLQLLHNDRDFDPFVKHLGLQLPDFD